MGKLSPNCCCCVNWYRQYKREHCAGSVKLQAETAHAAAIPLPRHLCPNPRCRRYRHPRVLSALFTVTDVEAALIFHQQNKGKEGLIRMPKTWNSPQPQKESEITPLAATGMA